MLPGFILHFATIRLLSRTIIIAKPVFVKHGNPPFLAIFCAVSAQRGMTWTQGFDGKALGSAEIHPPRKTDQAPA